MSALPQASCEQLADVGLAEAAVPTRGLEEREAPCLCPPSDSLGIDAKENRDLSRGKQTVSRFH